MECILRWLDDLDAGVFAMRMLCRRHRLLRLGAVAGLLILLCWSFGLPHFPAAA